MNRSTQSGIVNFHYRISAQDPKSSNDKIFAKKAIDELKTALELQTKNWEDEYLEGYIGLMIDDVANTAIKFGYFDEVEYFAEHLVYLATESNTVNDKGQQRAVHRFGTHLSYCILGRKALATGDIEHAKVCLDKLKDLPDTGYRTNFDELVHGLVKVGEEIAVTNYCDSYIANLQKKLAETDLVEGHKESILHSIEKWKNYRKFVLKAPLGATKFI